jgi:hypothetical protein
MFDAHFSGVLVQMSLTDPTTVIEAARSIPHLFAALPLDDNTVSVLAMLIGLAGGWTLTGIYQQMKAKRVKVEAEARRRLRKSK